MAGRASRPTSAPAPTCSRRPPTPRRPLRQPPLRPPRPRRRVPRPRRAARTQADLMNVITDTLRQLVRRKLWPVALVLVGALAAVPLVLAKQPEPLPPGPAANKVESTPESFVSA